MKKKFIIINIIFLISYICLRSGQFDQNKDSSLEIHPYIVNKITYNKDSTSTNGYTPCQIKHAYGIDKINATGEGQKIAIIVAYGSPTIENDFKIFNKKYGLESTEFNIKYPDGKPNSIQADWGIETSLDVEWVHALAPKASIILVVSKSESLNDLMSAVDFASNEGAHVVTMSWGRSECPEESTYDSHFKNENIIYLASSGDNGAGTQWPAVSPNVLAVGGTTFLLNSHGNIIGNETAWFKSGGGISNYEFQPNYQKKYVDNSNNYRVIPDVSFYADKNNGVSVYSSATGWIGFGGTSIGAPAWGAFLTLVNQKRINPLHNIHENLYQLAKSRKYSNNFRDITLGNNGKNLSNKGYDYVTGLGSPLANNLYTSLVNIKN